MEVKDVKGNIKESLLIGQTVVIFANNDQEVTGCSRCNLKMLEGKTVRILSPFQWDYALVQFLESGELDYLNRSNLRPA